MQKEHIPKGLDLTPLDDHFCEDPYSVYDKLRRLDPIHRDQQTMFQTSWTITDYQTVKAMLTDPRLTVDPRQVGQRLDPRAENAVTLREPDMMNLDGDEHAALAHWFSTLLPQSRLQLSNPVSRPSPNAV